MAPPGLVAAAAVGLGLTAVFAGCGDDGPAGGDATILRIDPATGDELWRQDTHGYIIDIPALLGDVVIVYGYDRLYAFDAHDGQELWTIAETDSSGQVPSTPADGVVLVSGLRPDERTNLAPLLAVDLTTGEERWRAGCVPGGYGYRVAAVGGGLVFLASTCLGQGEPVTEIVAYEAATGRERWRSGDLQYRNDGEGYAIGLATAPFYVSGLVVFANHDSKVWALDAGTGEVAWSRQVATPPYSAQIVPGQDMIFVWPQQESVVIALDAATGDELWRLETIRPAAGPIALGNHYHPLAAGGLAYVFETPSRLVALEAKTGAEVWSAEVDAGLLAADGDALYVGGFNSILALDVHSGATLWERTYQGVDGYFQLAASDGSLFATVSGEAPPYRD
ncbi:MAG: hypothetical protein Kow0010_11000 [Dehalococcoidia bacterium]